jgi:hypothetical protein
VNLGVATADVQPEVDGQKKTEADLRAEAGALLAALDDPSLGIGWQGSPIVDKWCGYTKRCPSRSGVSTGWQIAGATFTWFLGLLFSCVMLSLGAPFWHKTLTGVLNLKSAVQVSKQEATKNENTGTPSAEGDKKKT